MHREALQDKRSALSYTQRSITAMTNPELREHLDGLRHLKGFPRNEDSAVGVVVRYFADRGIVCTRDEARRIVREDREPLTA
jgi:hypothetical protein